MKSSRAMTPSSPPRLRTATVPLSASLSPRMSRYGSSGCGLRRSSCRSSRLRRSFSTRSPAASSAAATFSAASCRAVGDRAERCTCTGASHTGNAPAKCSVMMPMKRSMEPRHHAVDHNRAALRAVRAGVLQLKALGKLHVELDRAALPGTAEAVGQMEVQLRAVERAVALVDDVALAHLGHGAL